MQPNQGPKKSVSDLLFGTSAGKKEKKKKVETNWYVDFCKLSHKYIGKSAKSEITEEYENTLAFLGWKIKPEELNSAPLFVAYLGIGIAFVLAIVNYLFFIPFDLSMMSMVVYFGPFSLAFFAMFYIQNYPKGAAEQLRISSLSFIPEIVSYLVMSMKVTPNLEKAVTFAAEHGHGKIAADLKAVVFDLHIGKFKTMEEALDHIAWKWGERSEEFKHSLMLIRSSVLEADENKRNALLDKAVTDVLEAIQEKFDMYSRSMHSPSIYLYYFGVLLPLLLIIVIPVGAMMGGGAISVLAGAIPLMLIYNILIPLGSFVMAKSILKKRPPTRRAPLIPKDLPGLPKPGWFKIGKNQLPVTAVCVMLFVGVVLASVILSPILTPRPKTFEPGFESYCLVALPGDAEPGQEDYCMPFMQYAGLIWGAVLAGAVYLWAMNKDRRKRQLEIMQMENDFQDTLYVLASRLGEGRPMEDALRHASEFLPNSLATQRIFKPTLQNITLLGMTIKTALFDEAYGSLRYIPSDFISGTMRIVVDSLALGVQTASRSIISLSLQLRDAQKVEKQLKAMLEDITEMMSTMSIFIAPIVLGITIALQQIIIGAMRSMGESGLGQTTSSSTAGGISAFSAPSIGNPEALAGAAGPTELLFIITIYVIEVVIVLMWFASTVRDGHNDLAFKMNIAQSLPIAVALFFLVTYFAGVITALPV